MSAVWDPGTVAMIEFDEYGEEIALRQVDGSWAIDDGFAREVVHVRPLLVIDPEKPEDLLALVEAIRRHSGIMPVCHELQAALRSLIEPPKPDEPTGRYAVVSGSGVVWVRAAWDNARPWNKIGTDVWAEYDEIKAVEVLSKGVPS